MKKVQKEPQQTSQNFTNCTFDSTVNLDPDTKYILLETAKALRNITEVFKSQPIDLRKLKIEE